MAFTFKQSEKIQGDLLAAKESIQICLFFETGIWLFQSLLTQVKKGLRVELIVYSPILQHLDLSVQYFDRFYKSGGRFFELRSNVISRMPTKNLNPNFVLIDSTRNFSFFPDSNYLEISESDFAGYAQNFSFLKNEALLYGERDLTSASRDEDRLSNSLVNENRALEIRFQVDPVDLFPAQSFVLEWEVSSDARVFIDQGIGEVSHIGSKVLVAKTNQEFKLTAERNGIRLSKLVQIRVDESPVIRYRLTTVDIATGQEIILDTRNDFPHHFGIVKGQAITLYWEILNADRVSLDGFGVIPFEGFKVFTPVELRAFTIIAENEKKLAKQIIVVNVFHPPSIQKIQSSLPDHIEIKSSIDFGALDLPTWMEMPDTPDLIEATFSGVDEKTQLELKKRWEESRKQKTIPGFWSNLKAILFSK